MNGSHRLLRWLFAALLLVAEAPLTGAEPSPAPPHLAAVALSKTPQIDGTLDDPAWQSATHVEGFYNPPDNRPETERTEAWIGFDQQYLYAAFYCHDSHPEAIVAQQTQRGGNQQRDDYVSLVVDATRTLAERYVFRVSANGTQSDSIPNSGSGNMAWSGDWRAAAQRTIDGYTVEMQIPFTTLRFPAGQKVFGITFGRRLARMREVAYWPLMHDRFRAQEMAELGPLHLKRPLVKPVWLPYAIARYDATGPTIQTGLDFRHAFPNEVSVVATVNPDFKNVEDVVDSVAYSDVRRALDETRPFFRQGSRFFPNRTANYTRNIPAVDAGFKTYGALGPNEFGVMGTLSDHGRTDTAMDYTYKITPDIGLGSGLVTTSGASRPFNWVNASHFSAYHPLGSANLSYGGEYYHSHTQGEGGDGNAWSARASYWGDGHLNGWAGYTVITPRFRSENGYVPENDQHGWSAGISGGKRMPNHWLVSHYWDLSTGQRFHEDRTLLQTSYSGGGSLRFNNGMSCGLRLYTSQRPPNQDRTIGATYRWGLDTLYREGGLEVNFGTRGGAHYFFAKADQAWDPYKNLRLQLSTEYTNRRYFDRVTATDRKTQTILTGTYELDPYSSISGRFIERRGKLNLFVAWRNAPASGRTWTLFFGDPNADRTVARIQFKMTWPL